MAALDHPLAALLTAAAEPEGLALELLRQRLAALSPSGARVGVFPGELRWGGERFVDIDGPLGLSGHLARAGVSTLVIWRHLDGEAVRKLVFAPGSGTDLRNEPLVGLTLECPQRTQRPARALAAVCETLARDPETGVDLLTVLPGMDLPATRPPDFSDRLRAHLGRPRLAGLEADLRRSLRADAVRLHASERGMP